MNFFKRIVRFIGIRLFNVGAALIALTDEPRGELPTLPDVEATQKVEVPRWN